PNGSGKTTLFNLITGLIPLDGGSIRFEGEVINNLPPHKIAWKGLSRTFQTLLLFGEMTPEENVLVGLQCRARYSIWEAATRFGKKGRETRAMREKALEMMNFVGMKPWGGRAAKNLPYGEQRLLEIARALATDPSVILLDEPAAGMKTITSTRSNP
ncbi:MAG: ATP-binding cassette domain-containing protein, partial [Firmicutes bacterium]|nr:ATP-binding cassette domain-containing protein [Bacillota bacterium]